VSELEVRATGLLAQIDRARVALAEVETVEDAMLLADFAESVRYAARQAKAGMEVSNAAAEIRLRAERRAGELLAANPEIGSGKGKGRAVRPLEEVGVTKSQSSRYQQVAAVPDATFEGYVGGKMERGEEITTSELLRRTRESQQHAPAETPPLPEGVWDLLYADPPWRYEANSSPATRAIENHYPTMLLEEMCALEVPAADDALLFLWATSPKLAEALTLMAAWGFEYRTSAVWVKDRIGMGYYFRGRHELLLVGRRGGAGPPEASQRWDSVIEAPRIEHSKKPEVVYEMIEDMYPNATRLELFSRTVREGWDAWGNEATNPTST
jgi:N6-adenosine-specific RNA methylase IME4